MTNKEAIEMFKTIIMAEIERLPYHYDAKVDDDVYDDISKVNEILKLNKIVSKALEKADKYRWHDLRKNPDDLPYMDGDYLCFIDNEPYSYCSVCEWDNPNWYNYNGTESDNVIAWQYIEPLERI